jgi:LmbE family N-acetylglucosaminyl deacetylase
MNVVSIMAHQDDEMRCLGTMLRCKERDDTLAFVTVTDGSKGFVQNPGIAREEAARIRDTEMRSLATELNANYINLGYQDEFLFDSAEVRMDLIEAIRATQADVVFTHYGEDYNADHTTVHALVRHCAMHSCLPVLPTASAPLAAHPAVFLVEPHGPFVFPASHYVDISAHQARKGELLRHHVSQEEAMQAGIGSGLQELTAKLDAYRGDQVGVAYAEAFAPMRARGAVKPYPVLP